MFRKTNDVSFVELENKFDTNVEVGMNEGLPWDAFKDILSECDRRKDKEGPAFIPVTFKDKKEWVLSKGNTPSNRNEDNVHSISMIVLDLDQEGAFEKAKEFFSEFEYVVYSSHSYSKEEPYKLRIVLPLENEITPDEWRKAFDSLKHCIDADKQCGDLSRCYYFSSMNPDSGIEPYYNHNEGNIISLNLLNKATKKFIGGLSDEDKQKIQVEFNKDLKKDKYSVEKTHFASGGPVLGDKILNVGTGNYRKKDKDFSYDGIKTRHAKIIEKFKVEGSNDAFARDISWAEIQHFKQDVNIESLVQFIARASIEFYDPEHILSSSSDTLAQMPSKIMGAIRKADNEWYAQLPTDYTNNLHALVAEVRVRAKNSDWNFPQGIESSNLGEKNSPVSDNSYSETSMRKRFKSVLIDYHRNIDTKTASNLMTSIITQELRQNPEDFNVNKVSEFAFLQLERIYQKKYSLTSKDEVISYLQNDLNEVLNNQTDISNVAKKESQDFKEVWLKSAFIKAFACSTGKIKRTVEIESDLEKTLN
jgi:hypothetical protein